MVTSRESGKRRVKDEIHNETRTAQQPAQDLSGQLSSSRDSRSTIHLGSGDQTKVQKSNTERSANGRTGSEDFPKSETTHGATVDVYRLSNPEDLVQGPEYSQDGRSATLQARTSSKFDLYRCPHSECPTYETKVFVDRKRLNEHLKTHHRKDTGPLTHEPVEAIAKSLDLQELRSSLPNAEENLESFQGQPHYHNASGDYRQAASIQNPNIFSPPTPLGPRSNTMALDHDNLYGDYRVQPQEWFREGKVFSFMHHEPYNPSTDKKRSQRNVSSVIYNEQVYSQIRRAIIMKVEKGQSYVIPISTYSGRATLKPGVNSSDHAQVFSGSIPSPVKPGEYEKGLKRLPIRAHMRQDRWLDPDSRVDFSKTLTIQHNQKLRDLGIIDGRDFPTIWAFWRQVWRERIEQRPLTSNYGKLQSQQPHNQPCQDRYSYQIFETQEGQCPSQNQPESQVKSQQGQQGLPLQHSPQLQAALLPSYISLGQYGQQTPYLYPGLLAQCDVGAQRQREHYYPSSPQSNPSPSSSLPYYSSDSPASVAGNDGPSSYHRSSLSNDVSNGNVIGSRVTSDQAGHDSYTRKQVSGQNNSGKQSE